MLLAASASATLGLPACASQAEPWSHVTMLEWLPREGCAAVRSAGAAAPCHAHLQSLPLAAMPRGRPPRCLRRGRQRLALDRRQACSSCSSPVITDDGPAASEGLHASAQLGPAPHAARRRAPVATLRATKAGSLDVDEGPRPLGALPCQWRCPVEHGVSAPLTALLPLVWGDSKAHWRWRLASR